MPDGLSDKGEINIEIVTNFVDAVKNLEAVTGGMQHLVDVGDITEKTFQSIAGEAGILARELGNMAGFLSKDGASVLEDSAAWDALIVRLKEFIKMHREAAQASVVGGSLDGMDRASLEQLPTDELKKYIAIDDARKVNSVAVSRAIVAEREKAAVEEIALAERVAAGDLAAVEKVNQAKLAANAKAYADSERVAAAQIAENERVVAADLAAIEKESAARTAAYTAELHAAEKIDAEIAAAQRASRTATLSPASRNTANTGLQATAQDSYSAAQLTEMGAYYTELERTTAAQDRNNNATRRGTDATKAHTTSLIAARYALYDVSTSLAISGAGMLLFSGIAFKTAIDYQANFAAVARTTGVVGNEAIKLNNTLLTLTQTMPTSFADVTSIAAMAGQLGIANDQVGAFTKSVVEFSSTTNVSVDATATAYGRLNALLPDVKGNYDGLGSSILNVGINTVATESQIISISSRIAGIGASVGLTSSQIIGMSGALASLGIQPELAQGAVTRAFTKIQVAISAGGTALEQFGRVSGQSGEAFKAAWTSDPTTAFASLLSGINSQGPGAIEALKSIGITSARDIPTWLKLSQNVGLYTDSINLATEGTQKGTQLAANYAITSETVSAKLKTLGNNFTTLVGDLGKGAASMGGVIDSLTSFLQTLDAIAKNPAEASLASFGLALVGLTGVAMLAGAALLRLAAMRAALTTAQLASAGSSGLLATALRLITTGTVTQTVANGGLVVSNGLVATSMGTTSAAAEVLAISLKAITVVGLVLIGTKIAGSLHDQAVQALGVATSVDSATAALDRFNKKQIAKDLGLNAPGLAGTKSAQADPFGSVTAGAYGSLAGRASNTGVAAGQDFSSSFGNFTGLANISQNIQKYDTVLAALVNGGHTKQAAAEFKYISDAAIKQRASLKQVQAQFPLYAASVKVGSDAAAAAKKSADAYNNSVQGQSDTLKTAIGYITDAADATVNLQSGLFSLGGTLQAGGNDFSAYSEGGRANIKALESIMAGMVTDAAGNSQVLADNMQGLYNALTQGAKIPVAQLGILSEAIAAIPGVTSTNPVSIDLSSLTQGFDKAQQAANKTANSAASAAKQVHTLVDYASELSGVFNRAFDIRFSGAQGLDAITAGWSTIKTAIAATNTQIKGYQDTMQSLSSDKAINEYWLRVAQNYGDTLRVGVLQSAIAKNNSDLAANSSSLTDAQAASSKELNGNSDAAVANRAQILGLVKNYQSYIDALASSGMSQSDLATKTTQLKQDFISQATQLGYNKTELGQYASAFDDVSTAIAKIPRNINVTANINPALQALAEFDAKATAQGNKTYGGGTILPPKVSGTAALDPAIQKEHALFWAEFLTANGGGAYTNPAAIPHLKQSFQTLYGFTGWADGGYTGDGDKYDVAGLAHKGEFYFTKEQTTAIGRGNLESLAHSFKMPAAAPVTIASPVATAQRPMELAPFDRQLLMDIRDNIGLSIPGTAFQQVSTANNINSNNRGTN
jgi:TP901 family phage tail tape measure protein